MFNNVGQPIVMVDWDTDTLIFVGRTSSDRISEWSQDQVLECHPNQNPIIVSTHQCLGNAEEERMVLNEMAEGTDFTFVIKETFGCMIETV